MAKFVFKLQGVLRQRTHVEQEKMRALATCLKAQADAEGELASLNDSVKQTNDDLRRHHLSGQLDMSYLAAHRRFMLSMQRQAMGIAQKIAAAQQRVTEARIALAEAAKQRKVIEKIREKQFERWRTDQAARELRDLDEIGMQLSYRGIVEDLAARGEA